MQAISAVEPTRPLTTQSGGADNKLWTRRVVSLGRWMAILGVLRMISALAAWAKSAEVVQAGQPLLPRLSALGQSLLEEPLVAALCLAWPIVLGLFISQTRWRELLPIAASTFLLLPASELFGLMMSWIGGEAHPHAIGSFPLDREGLSLANPPAIALAALGCFQLAAELFVAFRAFRLLRQPGIGAESGDYGEAERFFSGTSPRVRLLLCRAGWLFSLLFVVAVVRLPVIPELNHIIHRSSLIRDLLLMGDQPRSQRRVVDPRSIDAAAFEQEREIERLMYLGTTHWGNHEYAEAKAAYERGIELERSLGDKPNRPPNRINLAMVENNLAWLLVTRPDPEPGDAEKAVEAAQNALSKSPTDGNYWNTLGTAHYRAKNWQAAKDALLRSMELRGDGDGYDWIIFSLVYAQTGRKDRAMDWYEKAVRWRGDFRSWDQEFYRFEMEAAKLLGQAEPPKPTPLPYRRHDESGEMSFRGRGLPMTPQLGEPRAGRRSTRRGH